MYLGANDLSPPSLKFSGESGSSVRHCAARFSLAIFDAHSLGVMRPIKERDVSGKPVVSGAPQPTIFRADAIEAVVQAEHGDHAQHR